MHVKHAVTGEWIEVTNEDDKRVIREALVRQMLSEEESAEVKILGSTLEVKNIQEQSI
jgi:hypothetical protein